MPERKVKTQGNGDGSVFQLPNKKWRAQITVTDSVSGAQRYRTKHAANKTAAKAELEALKRDYPIHQTRRRRLYYPAPPVDGSAPGTVGELLDVWAKSYMGVREDVSGSTRDNYLNMITKHIKPVLGQVLLSELDVKQIDDMLVGMRDGGLSISTIKTTRTVLGMALDHAKTQGDLPANYARDAKLPRNGKAAKVTPWLDRTDARKFLATAHAQKSPLEIAWVLQIQCGLRGGEVLALSWQDIDFDESTIHIRHGQQRIGGRLIPRGQTKTKTSVRDIPLSNLVASALKAHKAAQDKARANASGVVHWTPDDLILTTALGMPVRPETYGREFQKVRDAAELSEACQAATPHSLRHTYASILVQDGKMPWADIAKLLGHKDLTMLMETYGHLPRDTPRGHEDRLSDLMPASAALAPS